MTCAHGTIFVAYMRANSHDGAPVTRTCSMVQSPTDSSSNDHAHTAVAGSPSRRHRGDSVDTHTSSMHHISDVDIYPVFFIYSIVCVITSQIHNCHTRCHHAIVISYALVNYHAIVIPYTHNIGKVILTSSPPHLARLRPPSTTPPS